MSQEVIGAVRLQGEHMGWTQEVTGAVRIQGELQGEHSTVKRPSHIAPAPGMPSLSTQSSNGANHQL